MKPARRPREVNTHLLPPQLRMLVRIMGERAAFRLVEARGGTPLVVPVKCSPEHWLMDVVGPQAFAALVAEMAGMTTDLPKADSLLRQWRHQQVHQLVSRGLTDAEVALQAGYTRRHVINIRQAEAAAIGQRAQFDLFAAADRQLDAAHGGPAAGACVTAEGAEGAEAADDTPTAHDPFRLRPARAARTV